MKKISFLLLAMCITLAIVLAIEPTSAWFEALPLANSAEDAGKLAEGHFGKAIRLLKQENFQDAIVEYEKVIKLLPKSKIAQDAQYWIGQSYFRMGQLDEALSIFEKLIKDYPGSAIIPVTQLMMARVQKEKENNKLRAKSDATSDKKVIIDSRTGVKYTKTKTFFGKRDVIDGANALNLSPNGKFLLQENLVIPLDSGDPFELVDMPVGRGTWSPDGKKAAFYSKDAIWVMPVSPETGQSTGPPRKLLDGKYRYQFNVSWSPDGKKLVFARHDEEFTGDVWIISVTDGSLTQITSTPERELAPAWSPDGKTIAYGRYGKKHSLWLSSVDGETSRKIIDTKRRCVPIWFPDGKWVFLDETFRFIRIADKKEYALTTPEEVGAFFSWSPDGKKMLFYRSSYSYRVALKVVSASGGPTLELGRELTLWAYEYFWSPDNKMIITGGEDKEGDWTFWIIPLAGDEAFPLELDVSVTGEVEPSSLSPDCNKLLFSVEKSDGTEDLWVVPISLKDARTTGPAVMIFKGCQGRGRSSDRSWSPDGSKIAIRHEGDVWIANVEGGKPVQLTKTPEVEGWPGWSPDGKIVQYIIPTGGKGILHLIPASGGKEIMRLEAFDDIAWSPDGKEIAVAFKNNQLSVISIVSGKTRRIADLKDMGLTEVYDLCWSPDGRNLACVGYHTEKEQSGPIFIIPVDGGKATEIATDDQGWKWSLYWSPDSKWISYNSDRMVKTRPEGTIWEVNVKELLSKGKKEQKK